MLPDSDDDSLPRYEVVLNDEEQYSLWAIGTPPPSGWRRTGFVGDKDEVLDHIAEVWTDIRPKSSHTAATAGYGGPGNLP